MSSAKDTVNGIFILDKPLHLSSNAALQRVKKFLNAKKAGHTGSLDPLATGILPIFCGHATKFSQYLLNADKTYEAVGCLGITTATGDTEGEITGRYDVHITDADVRAVLPAFIGDIKQIPPMYSAIKYQGQPLYKLARQGKNVSRSARVVTIFKLQLSELNLPYFKLTIKCSKGTYIRTLVEDIGKKLQCGAHVTVLRRTGAGPYTLLQSQTLEWLASSTPGECRTCLLSIDSALYQWPSLHVTSQEASYLLQGKSIQKPSLSLDCTFVKLYIHDGPFIGLGEVTSYGELRPKKLIPYMN